MLQFRTHQDMIKSYFISLLASLKNSFIAAASVFSAFVAPIGDLLGFVSILIIADFITGVIAAKYKGEVRSSAKMMRSVYKMLFYTLALMLMQMFDGFTKTLFKPHLISLVLDTNSIETLNEFKFLAALAFIIVIRELKSIDENWQHIFGWSFISYGVNIYDSVISILLKLKNK